MWPLLADNYTGPYLVLEKRPKVFKLPLGTQQEVVSRERLKPHMGTAPAVAEPPRRGRPPWREEKKIFLRSSEDLQGVVLRMQEIPVTFIILFIREIL